MSIQSERISERIKKENISYTELSKRTGIARSALQRYAAGTTAKIPHDRIALIADALNVSAEYLMGWSDSETNLPEGAQIYNPVIHRIPVLGEIAAGLPIYAEQNIESYTYTEHNGGAQYFALRVKGDSMNAANINDGGLLIVRRQDTVENGEIAVVMVNKENATVKRFKRSGSIVSLIPQSYNPAHKTQIYDIRRDDIKVIGKVVESKFAF